MINLGDNFVLSCSKLFHGVFHKLVLFCSVFLECFVVFILYLQSKVFF